MQKKVPIPAIFAREVRKRRKGGKQREGERSSADRANSHQVMIPVVATSRASLGRSRGERTRREEKRRGRGVSVLVGRCSVVVGTVFVVVLCGSVV